MSESTSPGLVVPIDVDALCLTGSDDPPLSKPFADFSLLAESVDEPYVSETALTTPMHGEDGSDPDPGIRLHWALPDALTHGHHDGAQGRTAFPPLPTRWLVVRSLVTDGGSTTTNQRAWIVESDYVATQPPGGRSEQGGAGIVQPTSTVPLSPESSTPFDGNNRYAYIGRAIPLQDWGNRSKPSKANYEEGTYPYTLTVVGYGEPGWAAVYPNCPASFGLFESAETLPSSFDPDTQALQYTVVGWYHDDKNDPVHGTKAADLLDAYDWALASGSEPPTTFGASLYHGSVTDVSWKRGDGHAVPGTSDLSLSVGNDAPEAVSALIAAKANGASAQSEAEGGSAAAPDAAPKHKEFWFNALQLGLLGAKDLSKIEDVEKIRQQIHSRAFDTHSFTRRWVVTPVTDDTSGGPSGGRDPLSEQALKTLTDPQLKLLDELNDLQRRHDRLAGELQSRRSQLFADWWRFMVAQVIGEKRFRSEPPKDDCEHTDYLCRLYRELFSPKKGHGFYEDFLQSERVKALEPKGKKQKKLTRLQAKIEKTKSDLSGKLSKKLKLTSTRGGAYVTPSDPVVLAEGPVARPTTRHGQDGRHREDGQLRCRLTSDLVSSVDFDGAITLKRGDLPVPSVGTALPGDLVDAAKHLVEEALLLDPKAAAVYAGADASTRKAYAKALRTALSNEKTDGTNLSVKGELPSPTAVSDWSPPWNPIMLEWQVELYPIRSASQKQDGAYPTDYLTQDFEFEHADLTYASGAGASLGHQQTYQGRVPLTPGARDTLHHELHNIPSLKNHPKLKNLEKKLEKLSKASLLAQSMGGFHQWMLTRKQVFQLGVEDPELGPFGSSEMKPLRKALGQSAPSSGAGEASPSEEAPPVSPSNRRAPVPRAWFNPLRASVAQITNLRVVDSFGQIVKVDLTDQSTAPDVHVADALKVPEKLQNKLKQKTSSADAPSVFFPPRLCQASRLNFDWISATGKRESGSHPRTSPICGWLVPIYLTSGLMVFAQDGQPLGTLYVIEQDGRATVVWQDAPLSGDAATAVKDAEKQAKKVLNEANANETLRKVVVSTIKNGGRYLENVLHSMKYVHSTVDPGYHQEAPIESLIMGQPLAVTRARLGMELHGLPALDQSYEAAYNYVRNDQSYEDRSTRAFDDVDVPVKLGSLGRHYDGLVGYFADDTYDTFYTLAARDLDQEKRKHPHVKSSTGSGALALTPTSATNQPEQDDNPSRTPRDVTLLMDPRTKVHATTGVQPVSAVEIPTRHYEPVLRKLKVTVLSAPVLSGPTPAAAKAGGDGASNFGVPLPATKEGTWNWVERQSTGNSVNWTATSADDIHDVSAKRSRSYPRLGVREGWLRFDRSGGPSSGDAAGDD